MVYCFHPTVKQVYKEAVRTYQNLKSFRGNKNKNIEEQPPTLENIKKNFTPTTIEPEKELQELIGFCLWDIFSDNREVVDENRIYEIGSFRGAAGFIADYLNDFNEFIPNKLRE